MIVKVNIIQLYNPRLNELPRKCKEEQFSEDVLIIDEQGLNGVAFYDYETEEWNFHTDTLVDYNEIGNETKWWWYYPPVTKDMLK